MTEADKASNGGRYLVLLLGKITIFAVSLSDFSNRKLATFATLSYTVTVHPYALRYGVGKANFQPVALWAGVAHNRGTILSPEGIARGTVRAQLESSPRPRVIIRGSYLSINF